MSSTQIGRLDSKGRLIVPAGFRSQLRLKPDSEVLVSLDDKKAQLIITPTSERELTLMKIGLSDAPGSLAKVAKVLADFGVDLVSTESHSVSRGKTAVWEVICSSDSITDSVTLKKSLLLAGATSFSVARL